MIESRSPVERVLSAGGVFAPETGLAEAAEVLGIADPERLADWFEMIGFAVETQAFSQVVELVLEHQVDGMLPARPFVEIVLSWLESGQQRATNNAFVMGLAGLADALKSKHGGKETP